MKKFKLMIKYEKSTWTNLLLPSSWCTPRRWAKCQPNRNVMSWWCRRISFVPTGRTDGLVGMVQGEIFWRKNSKNFKSHRCHSTLPPWKHIRGTHTPIGPMPGPPPPCGMQKVLWRFKWETSDPKSPGLATPTRAFIFAPSMYTCPPHWCTLSQISLHKKENTYNKWTKQTFPVTIT